MESHHLNTIQRCLATTNPILLVSDSVFMSPPKKNMMDGLKSKGMAANNNLRIHYLIAVDSKSHEVLGMTDFRIIGENIRKTNIKMKEECDIWELVTRASLKRVKDNFPEIFEELRSRFIFIADREADAYHIFESFLKLKVNFIIRSAYRRRVAVKNTIKKVIFSQLVEQEINHGKSYELTLTENGKKKILKVQRSVLKNYMFYPPWRNSSIVSKKFDTYPPIKMNMVFVREIDSQYDKERIEWRVLTT